MCIKTYTPNEAEALMALKTSPLLLGIPISWLMITTVIISFLTYFFGYGWFFIVVAIGLLTFLAPIYIKRKLILPISSLPFAPRVAITGLKETFFPTIDALIRANKKVKVGLPLDRALRAAVEYYVESRLGVIEIVDSGDPVVGSESLPETTLTVVESTPSLLQDRVNQMLSRGWYKVGESSSTLRGFSRRYTQTLHYNPART